MDRPRRTNRPSAKLLAANEAPSSPPAHIAPRPKRKFQNAWNDPEAFLHFVLKNPKSPLTSIDISSLINGTNWNMLSPESQEALKLLLPPTAFLEFHATIDPTHPSASSPTSSPDDMAVDPPNVDLSPSSVLDMSIFTDAHFLAAAHTFQDHIYSGWMSDSHAEKVRSYENGIREGTLSAAWKDEVWIRDNTSTTQTPSVDELKASRNPLRDAREFETRAGAATEVKLVALVKKNILRVGDVIAYKRTFLHADLVVEKDVIIQSIHPKNDHLTVLFSSGPNKHLPASFLIPHSTELNSAQPVDSPVDILSATIFTPSMLETALLDTDSRVEKSRRPNGNAWKSFTVYRWRGDDIRDIDDSRGGRENHGTLFYLRGTYHHER